MGIDMMVRPAEVAGIETYKRVEAPVEYMPTRGLKPLPCLTLIWTK
jgi:hypothetical protein